MKQYRILSRDAEFSKAWPKIETWWDWEEIWEDVDEAKDAIERNKDRDIEDGYRLETTEYKIEVRDVSEWRKL